ncbi:lyase family protein [Saccharicrinis fermentans]|uniref:Aspartate ammonia-lyase n=1 Tax=Saccharicrinis fermentans DSM 9555 = JCM 21142 TaxID=869213 RepID=W7YR49_9BACT|nr:lyase family protein [Saccharicrinis fermentans]GAF04914.1 aspartate ammonia-lyase [Saccharicrinis fermentans DSM 9555 = JCM 21142]
MRIEKDFIGSCEIPKDALYGINSLRAKQNFPNSTAFHKEWFKAVGIVKHACYKTYQKYKQAALQKYPEKNLHFMSDEVIEALKCASIDISKGNYFEHFIIPAIQGGAGTSINLNINEIISNLALQKLGKELGEYHFIDPIEHANIYQSTNDVIPTALKVALIFLFKELDVSINRTTQALEKNETNTRNRLRQAYTQMQTAVPSSYDKLFGGYGNALSRDWWRVSKCSERIKEVNLGGGAIGTGIAIPSYFIMEVVSQLQRLTGLPITRSENLSDTTSNLDSLVEVHASLKAHAVNMEKMAADLRLMASDLFKNREILLPQKQVGSSIMPGKVNPVISEYIISSAHKIYANDQLVSSLCAQGCLDLNAYLPTIGHAMIESTKLLITCNRTITDNLLTGLQFKKIPDKASILKNPSLTTALSPYIGYHQATQLADLMNTEHCSISEANTKLQLVDPKTLDHLLKPAQLLKLGYRLNDVIDNKI